MNKALKYASAAIVFFLFFAVPVYAHAPTVVIESIDGHPVIPGEPIPIIIPALPWTVYIEGYVEHDGNYKNVTIRATDNDEIMYGPEILTNNSGYTVDGTYEIPWLIESAGVHVIRVVAAHGNHESSTALGGNPQNSKKGCPAAPSIANKYLKENNINKKGIISKVAHQTGKKGELWAKESCAPDYEEHTITFIVNLEE